jgi:hypothetical protein
MSVIQSVKAATTRAWLAFKRFWNYKVMDRKFKGKVSFTYEGAAPGCVHVIRDDGVEYDYPEG